MRIRSKLRMHWLCALSLLVLAGCSGPANQPAKQVADARIANAHDATSIPAATGHFDYYLLTLSWSPEYCHGHRNSPQCGGGRLDSHPGFVVHGLWPQYQDGHWPSQCSNAPGLSDPSSMLDIMPDPRLVAHEWATHGTCTGLSAEQYFATVRKAYQSIKIPPALVDPTQRRRASADSIKQLFVDANPGMSASDIAISCHNRYLGGVEFCLNKRLQPIACQAVRDCTASSITIPTSQ